MYDANNTAICTFKFEANVANSLSLLTAPSLTKGSNITIKYGTTAPTESLVVVKNNTGDGVFFVSPTVQTSGTTTTVTTK